MSILTNALSNFYKLQTYESQTEFFKKFRESVDNKLIVFVPVIKVNGQIFLCIFEKRGQQHGIMFSDETRISHKFNEDRILKIDIPTFLNILYNDSHLQGMAIDPDSPDSICITRSILPEVSGIPDPRRMPKNWGKGIPKYEKNDLMTDTELFDFAMQIIRDYELHQNGYEIIDEYISQSLSPNFIAMKNGKKYYITVKADIAPNIPKLTLKEKMDVQAIARRADAIACFASVSIGSSDMDRFNASLALCGDGFYTRYTGLEYLDEPMTTTSNEQKDPLITALRVLCKCYSTGDFEPLFPLLSENIELNSMWVLEPLKGKEKVVEYYLGKGETVRNAGVFAECYIVQLLGNMNSVRADRLYVNGEQKTGSVGLWYQDGKYCMLMTQKLKDGNAQGIIDIKLDDDNKIKEISICMPELFKYKYTNLYQSENYI